jgi:Flp pilus assembly CpaF family ATPase
LDRFSERHHEVVALEAREANVEEVEGISCADLVRWAMRMSANQVIVGEVLGDEIVPMLNAMNSGAAGSMCTLHGGACCGGTVRTISMPLMPSWPLTVQNPD